VIGQAKGILMEREGVTADEAYDMLRRSSQNLNVKLRDLAAKVAGSPAPKAEEVTTPGK
jgi:AmiR/NasT family two-component response regulator